MTHADLWLKTEEVHHEIPGGTDSVIQCLAVETCLAAGRCRSAWDWTDFVRC